MSENNSSSKWMMWAVGLMLTVGIAANGMTVNWVNGQFHDHAARPHVGTVEKDQFETIYRELKNLQEEVKKLQNQVTRLDERLRQK